MMSLKLVVLKSPYRNWQVPNMSYYFSKMIELKHKGYQKNYPEHYLPVDTIDLIGTHHLVCMNGPEGDIVLSGFKTVFYEQCEFHRMPFPVVSMMTRKDQASTAHFESVMKIIEKSKQKMTRVSYSSSWTINPDYKDFPELVFAAKKLCIAMLYWHCIEYSIKDEFLLGVVKAKTDLFFTDYGYEPISNDGNKLPPFKVVDVDQKEVRLLHRVVFNENAKLVSNQYDHLNEKRLVIGSSFGVTDEVSELAKVA